MFGEIVGNTLSTLRIAVSVLLIGTLLSIAVSRLYSADENGVRIGNLYKPKRAVIMLVIALPLLSALAFGFFQPALLDAFRDPRILSSALGLLFPLLLFRANDMVENWDLYDGNRETIAILCLSLVLLFGPWLGPIIIDYLLQQAQNLLNFAIHQLQLLVASLFFYVISGITSVANQAIQIAFSYMSFEATTFIFIGCASLVIVFRAIRD